jgi:hypothetical protein
MLIGVPPLLGWGAVVVQLRGQQRRYRFKGIAKSPAGNTDGAATLTVMGREVMGREAMGREAMDQSISCCLRSA